MKSRLLNERERERERERKRGGKKKGVIRGDLILGGKIFL
jgi:hypothetical protein